MNYKLAGYIKTIRLEGALIAIVFLLLGEWYSFRNVLFYPSILLSLSIFSILTAGSWINYVFDKEIDEVASKDVDFFKYISKREMLLSSLILSIIGLILLLFINLIIFFVGVGLFLIFYIYAAPPIRLKTLPPLDCIANALGFGILPFIMGWFLAEGNLTFVLFIFILIVGFSVVSYYLFISSFDIESDKEGKIETSCTKLGFNNTITVGVVLFFIAFFLAITFTGLNSIITIAFVVCLPMISFMKIITNREFIKKVISASYLLWTGVLIFLLYIYTQSIIALILLSLVLIITIFVVTYYLTQSKNDRY